MTRIVAGAAKGRRLLVPARGTRPTSERAREGLFNSLRSLLDVQNSSVLDLYAGSGAVGLEALSRGAATATLVESDRAACDVIRRNATAIGLPGALVRHRSVTAFLEEPPGADDGAPYHLVFADPPYQLDDEALASVLRQVVPVLADDAVLVLERPARGAPGPWPDGVAPLAQRRYGDGVLWYGRRT